MMELIDKIKKWAKERPAWQQEALRRIWDNDTLTRSDIAQLTELCKKPHGLSETSLAVRTLDNSENCPGTESILLESITHNGNVNALAPGQKIGFGPNLTVVYGENGAGKSGYSKILKSACRARGSEEIIGNVLSGEAPGIPSATIGFSTGGESKSLEWRDDQPEPLLYNVSVFDSTCALVYLKDKTDVAYRPFGLDLFDRLSNACTDVRSLLEKEKRMLERPTELPNVPSGTIAAKALANLSGLTVIEPIRAKLELNETEQTRRILLREQLQTLREEDPTKKIRELQLKAARIRQLATLIASIEDFEPGSQLEKLKTQLTELSSVRESLVELEDKAFSTQPLLGTGGEEWQQLWLAAERFSKAHAYVGFAFPVAEKGKHCVLCQQELGSEGASRLAVFSKFLSSRLSTRLTELKNSTQDIRRAFTEHAPPDVTETIEELKVESSELGVNVGQYVQGWRTLVESVDLADRAETIPSYNSTAGGPGSEILKITERLLEQATELSKALDPEHQDELLRESRELEARHLTVNQFEAYEAEVNRQRKLGAYERALKDTSTNAISRKSGELTRETVTEKLVSGFRSEVEALKFKHIEVELVEAGAGRGSLYHKLALKRNTGITVAKVVSEGEARCLAIAAFFAELSTGGASAPIVFDDPVSSLDHLWRERIASRLAKEASRRQVIVFTHDIVFLLALKGFADDQATCSQFQYLRRGQLGSGMSAEELPWPALKAKDRVGHLKQRWQTADKCYRTDDPNGYQNEAIIIYGLLRETWERAFEEVLLGGVVERYRGSIQTRHAKVLCDITDDDMTTFESGMSKTSRWLPGHDLAAAEGGAFPDSEELKTDIAEVEQWIQSIKKRR